MRGEAGRRDSITISVTDKLALYFMGNELMNLDPDFAGPVDYARAYRSLGIQAVPGHSPLSDPKNWKRPAIPWAGYEDEIVSDSQFEEWFGPGGRFAGSTNVGMITGAASGGLFILDADIQKIPLAETWLAALKDRLYDGQDFPTPCQRTGGGGLQYLFKAPPGWTPPTGKSSLGIDVRGKGGFAVLPPSVHESGRSYQWMTGRAPWEQKIIEAPEGLCQAIDELLQTKPQVTPLPAAAGTLAGALAASGLSLTAMTDGREDKMHRMIFGRLVDLYRQSPFMPAPDRLQSELEELWRIYERMVAPKELRPGETKAEALNREGRGSKEFERKWRDKLARWDTKVAEVAAKPAPEKSGKKTLLQALKAGESSAIRLIDEATGLEEEFGVPPQKRETFERLNLAQIDNLPDPEWLVEGLVIDNSLGFIYGAPGTGKSFIALGMALSIASHQPEWWSRKVIKPGPVLYISSEGVGDIKFRIRAWKTHFGVDCEPERFNLIRQSINFMDAEDVGKLMSSIDEFVQEVGEIPSLVVVDTVSRVLPGADENLQKDMTLFIKACDHVRERYGCTVLGVHHTSRAGNLRGSTVFDGAGDCLVHVVREVDAESQQVTDSYIFARKIKAAADGWRQDFQLKKVVVDLKGTESLVAIKAEPVSPLQAQQPSGWPDRVTQIRILEIIEERWRSGDPLSNAVQTRKQGRYAPSILHGRLDIDADIIDKLLVQWLDRGILAIDSRLNASRTSVKGLRKGSVPLPFSSLSPMEPEREDSGVTRGLINQEGMDSGVVGGLGSDDDFG